jgi:hypothetical protein
MNGVEILLIIGIAVSAIARRRGIEPGLIIVVLAAAASCRNSPPRGVRRTDPGNSAACLGRRRYGRLMFTTHALLVSAMTPARGPLQSIRLRAGRLALACATA